MSYNHNKLAADNNLVKREFAVQLRKSMTKAECVVWNGLRANSLCGLHFRRQVVIRGFIVDFYCHEARLIVEIDGGVHNEQKEYDDERDALLTAHGYRLLRFSNSQVFADVYSVMRTIKASVNK